MVAFVGVPGHTEMLIIILFLLLPLAAVWILPFWLIFAKAGFPSELSLLMILPGPNLVVLLYIAFAQWPVHRELQRWVQGSGEPPIDK